MYPFYQLLIKYINDNTLIIYYNIWYKIKILLITNICYFIIMMKVYRLKNI